MPVVLIVHVITGASHILLAVLGMHKRPLNPNRERLVLGVRNGRSDKSASKRGSRCGSHTIGLGE